ncbi:ABC transporter permease [Gracilibacillus sp. Marseille-QA3620]
MSVNSLIWRSLKKNLKNYYLYIFALVFSVALYFSFVTLQYDPSMDPMEGTIKGEASIRSASILLIAIVTIFLVYANNIFMKRRSKEIAMYQLVGMNKSKVFTILNTENSILYFGSLLAGIFVGFSFSKLLMLILIRITNVDNLAKLNFSTEALIQTAAVFIGIFLITMLVNYFFIKRKGILDLFHTVSSTEMKTKKISVWEVLIGLLGLLLIITGYYVSSMLFDGDFGTINELFMAMIFILASVIIGTYFFYKGSIRFLFNLIRRKKNGYLTIQDVLSLSSIMFRMKSNAMLLTVITTVSALSIGLLSLSYIAYYSVEKQAERNVTADFSIANTKEVPLFEEALQEKKIGYEEKKVNVIQVYTDLEDITAKSFEEVNYTTDHMPMPLVSDTAVDGLNLKPDEIKFTGYSDMIATLVQFKDSGTVQLESPDGHIPLTYVGIDKKPIVSSYFTGGGMPVMIVDESVYEKLAKKPDPSIQLESSVHTGITIKNEANLEKANEVFLETLDSDMNDSRYQQILDQKNSMGLLFFVVAFLGLTFLITSGCILYFKQMDEGEEELPNYTILRKLGFTEGDLLKGIIAKQIFNFGIPLIIGLCHGYFAVQSGWFFFGSDLWTPMLIVMVLYTGLYSIFGILSVLYYKKLIKKAL